ncbi:MAG TPA: uracil-DNA glycosylase, partial [Conexibacter sp.]|nr:uracil-DNA glycosylase [Conexibacter sp.]
LAEIGLERGDVFIANVLKCRPPGNRDPRPQEIEACRDYLHRQVDLIEPRVICTLGNFSTKLLRGDPTGISRLHGQPEVHVLGHRAVRLYPIYHPAAALYTPSMLETLRTDFARLPELLATDPPPQPERGEAEEIEPLPELEPVPEPAEPLATEPAPAAEAEASASADQLDLFS